MCRDCIAVCLGIDSDTEMRKIWADVIKVFNHKAQVYQALALVLYLIRIESLSLNKLRYLYLYLFPLVIQYRIQLRQNVVFLPCII